MSIHRLIREGRRRLGMSEQQFADAVGVSRGAVQQWEKPGGTAPKRSNQPRVAEMLGMSIAELLSGGSNTT
ncbi:MAG: XRE family transcriptional regulator, partial [Comamonadaceae bacterium]